MVQANNVVFGTHLNMHAILHLLSSLCIPSLALIGSGRTSVHILGSFTCDDAAAPFNDLVNPQIAHFENFTSDELARSPRQSIALLENTSTR